MGPLDEINCKLREIHENYLSVESQKPESIGRICETFVLLDMFLDHASVDISDMEGIELPTFAALLRPLLHSLRVSIEQTTEHVNDELRKVQTHTIPRILKEATHKE
jgi:hypothetical protein